MSSSAIIRLGSGNRCASRHGSIDLGSARNYARFLSAFQVEKFSYLFDAFFDTGKHGLITEKNMSAFIEKLRSYAGWAKNSIDYQHLLDVHSTFQDCIVDQVKAEYLAEDVADEECLISWDEAFRRHNQVEAEPNCMDRTQWLNMWGRLSCKAAGIKDFPIWVQLLPDIFFDVIDRDRDGVLNYDNYKNFYEYMIGIKDPVQLEKVSNEGYRAMTANGQYKLNREHYKFCFANFLLGKNIYGPGKYIFGVFDNRELEEKFKIDLSIIEDDEDDDGPTM